MSDPLKLQTNDDEETGIGGIHTEHSSYGTVGIIPVGSTRTVKDGGEEE